MTADAVGGVWTYATELRAALRAAGVDVLLVTLGPAPPPDAASPYLPCRLEWQPDPWEDVRDSGRRLLELAAEARPDVVHLNGFAHAALPWRAPVVVAAHSCVASWHEAVRGAPAGPEWARYREAVARGLRAADAVVAPTAAMRAALRRHHGLARGCSVFHNGVSPHPGGAQARRPLVLAAGRLWDAAKGLDALDRAAARISWPVAVAGDAGGLAARHVELLGVLERDELRRRMGQAAIFAHPARYEPFGLVVLEAALAGCALVLGDIPSLRELWDGAALFVAPGDPEALAGACERLVADEPLRGRFAWRARERAGRYDAARMAARYTHLYERLHDHHRRAVAA
ncbi:MAG: glycogen synthase [Solirubrobacteraceae bacterium]|nr:glycogen synthase [Solirubrobacteraceae bacterium]